ncbi:uncharacterized protein LODBEIA_P54860 [Lodderomyces beijingensis]|uniref:DNA polymerase delta small subunit n=1 Tax=Lodderomyces beijingensis TaxID=1775926 RepID=A0ABP0ZT17_9ASCO
MKMEYTSYLNNATDSPAKQRSEVNIPSEFDKRNEFFISPTSRKYDKQYFSMYQYRLTHLKKRVIANAMKKWGHEKRKVDGQTIVKQDKILDIKSGQLCWVVGTVFCDAKYKLNILSDVDKGTDDVLPLIPVSYVDNEEQPVVMLEDESGRAVLHNEVFLKKNLLVTGCIVAVLGIEIQAGIFEIMDVVYPECAPQTPLPPKTQATPTKNKKVQSKKIAIVSGLNIGLDAHYDMKLELLKQYLTGELGSEQEQELAASISRLIIAGNSIEPIRNITAEEDLKNYITTNNYGSKNIPKFTTESLQQLDHFINEIITSLPVSVMPGENDPAEICWPQQQLHKSLFKSNSSIVGSDRLQRLTNPVWLEIEGVHILGTSGENVADVKKYASGTVDTMQIMHASMKWQNFVPTAPDTLYCYPYDEYDPFIFVSELPHVYFVGNQDKFEVETYVCEHSGARVVLVSVPEFKKSKEVVIFDLDELTGEVVRFEV